MSDMPLEEFRKNGHQLVDWIADYLNDIEKYQPLSQVNPGDILKRIPQSPPQKGEDIENVLNDVDKILMDGITHWNHPGFMAYFNSTSSGPGILAEFLTAALGVNGMLWKTSPAFTELERAMMNWFRQMVGLPENYWGIIYDTASTSSMHAVASAREQLNLGFREKGMAGRSDVPRLRGAHQQTHLVVNDQVHPQFLPHPFDRLAAQHVQVHRLLEVFQIRFDLPPRAVQFRQLVRRISLGVQQCRHQRDLARAKARPLDPVTQFTHHDLIRQLLIVLLAHPRRFLAGFDVRHQLVQFAQLLDPARGRRAFALRLGPLTPMLSSGGEVDDLSLMHAEHAVQFVL